MQPGGQKQIQASEEADELPNQIKEELIFNAQKRALMIELMKFIIDQKNYFLNEKLKPIIVNCFLQLKEAKLINKGVVILVNMFGNPIKVAEEYAKSFETGQLQKIIEAYKPAEILQRAPTTQNDREPGMASPHLNAQNQATQNLQRQVQARNNGTQQNALQGSGSSNPSPSGNTNNSNGTYEFDLGADSIQIIDYTQPPAVSARKNEQSQPNNFQIRQIQNMNDIPSLQQQNQLKQQKLLEQ